MFFDGSHDSKKKVSLGGKSRGKTQESKQQFVERTRKEREARELERRRERSALQIQAFTRGRRATAERRDVERQGWDESFQMLKKIWSEATKPEGIAEVGKEFELLLRRLLFFYRADNTKDNERLSIIGFWMVVNGTGANTKPGVKILAHLYASRDSGDVKRRIKKFCSLCLQRLKRTVASAPSNMQALDAGVLVQLCNRSVEGQGAAAESLLESLLREGLMEVVRARLDADDEREQATRQPLQLVLISLVVQALGGGDRAPVAGAYESLCSHLLTRSMFLQRLSTPARKAMELDGMWESVLAALTANPATLAEQFCGPTGSVEGASSLLGNLVELSTTSLSTSSPKETGLFALSAGKLLAFVRQLQDSVVPDEEDEMDDVEMESQVEREQMEVEVETAAGITTVQHTRIRSKDSTTQRLSPALAAVKQHIQAICNKEYVCKLLDVVQKVPPPTETVAGKPDDVPPQDFLVVSATCGLLMQLLEFLPEATTDVLNALAFKPAVLSMLWDWFMCVSKPGKASVNGEDSLLTMFSLVYHHLLMTVDNAEFYEKEFPFALDQVRTMVGRLKGSVYTLYWDPPSSVVGKRLRASGTALLNRLFERNCFKEFVPPEAWQASDRHVNAVMSELDSWSAARLDPNQDTEADGMDPKHALVLRHVPFALPFPMRVRILRHQILRDKAKLMDVPMNWVPTRVQRSRVVEDGYLGLNALGPDLKRTIQISFVNQEGLMEAGIDGGGLFKEFINTLSGQAFNPHYGLFRSTPDKLLFPNPQAETAHPWQGTMDHLKLFEFLGRMVGKAIYDGILIELRLAPFFLRKILGKEMYFDDLKSLDPDLYKNLMFVKNYTGDFEDLSLNFEVVEDNFGEHRGAELIPNGRQVPVTADNVLRYKNLVADYWLNRRIQQQSQAFMRGLSDLMEGEWLRMFSPDELQMIISGSVQPIDIQDLRRNCVYGGTYTEDHESVQLFWKVVEGFDPKQREDLLLFVTSCSRPPLLGFKELFPAFCIQKTAHPPEEVNSRLPTASTCMNLLKLPAYTSESDCRDRILYAISAGAGFELS